MFYFHQVDPSHYGADILGPNVEQHRVVVGENSPGYDADGEIISTQTVSSKTRTVETITVNIKIPI